MSSFGEQIKRERELRKISLEDIAEATKISARYLRALERNDFSELPGGVFARGYVRAYAQFVGLDEEATVEAYLAEVGPEEVVQRDDGLDALRNAVETRPAGTSPNDAAPGNRLVLRWVAVAVVAVGLVSVTAWGLSRYFQKDGPASAPARETARVAEPRIEPSPQQPVAGAAVEEPAEETIAAPSPAPAIDEEDRTADPEPEPAVEAAPPPPTPVTPPKDTQDARPRIDARILIDRAATGRVNCDNRRIEMLDGLRPGTELKLQCQRFLLLNVRDGGAVRVGLNGETPMQLTADGEPLDDFGIYP